MSRFAGLTLVFFLGCSVDQPCDPGQQSNEQGFCASTMAAGGAAAGGSGDAGAAGGAVCEDPSNFGDQCAQSSECNCKVDYCALQPGATTGVCTRTGCVEDGSVCPETWQCLDLSAFGAGLPSICVPPQ
jgi:hypothetical protein